MVIEDVSNYDYLMTCLEGSIDGAIDWLEHVKEECEKAGYLKIWLEIDYDYGNNDKSLVVKGERWETDKEFEKRLKNKRKRKKNKRKRRNIKYFLN